jgi:hypothetical protein
MKVFGLTRFSVLAGVGLKQTRHLPYEQRAEHILGDARLDHRMRLFRAFVIPELRLMTKQNKQFRHLVFISPEMPLIWKLRLRMSLIGIRHKVVTVRADENLIYKARQTVADLANGDEFFTFRVDDDDALPSGYMRCVLDNKPAAPEYKALSCDEGYFIKKLPRDRYLVDRRKVPLIAIGLGLYVPKGADPKTVFCLGNHEKINEQVSVERIMSPRWLRTVHDTNDSMLKLKDGKIYSPNQMAHLIQREFPALTPSRAMACL